MRVGQRGSEGGNSFRPASAKVSTKLALIGIKTKVEGREKTDSAWAEQSGDLSSREDGVNVGEDHLLVLVALA